MVKSSLLTQRSRTERRLSVKYAGYLTSIAGCLPNRYARLVASRSKQAAEAATELMKAMTRLRARLRTESAPTEMPATWSQVTTLGRIVAEGPITATALAQAEHVRRQSMAETLAALRASGLITSEPDPDDGRKTLIKATPKGQDLHRTIPAAREAWLASAIRALLDPDEQQTLLKAAAIMNRIADGNPDKADRNLRRR
jgi:DNA-binding MarR family transcriptional regulator